MKKSVKAFAAASLVALFATVAMSCGSTAAPAKAEEPAAVEAPAAEVAEPAAEVEAPAAEAAN